MNENDLTLVVTNPGHEVEYRGRNSFEAKAVTIDKKWDVLFEGQKVAEIEYRMVTHETRTAGRRYVNSRWKSPGWTYQTTNFHRSMSSTSRKACLRSIAFQVNYERDNA